MNEEMITVRKACVDVGEDSVHIYDANGEEIVSWIQDEWIDDPSVTISIANAIRIFYIEGPDVLKATIGRL